MFLARKPVVLPDSVIAAGKADGFVHLCEQSALSFGSDRRQPTVYRPIVAIRADGPRFIVLPCTSGAKTDQPDFFELNDKRVMWSRPSTDQSSFAHYRYEVVAGGHLKGKIGVMPQAARIDLLSWLKTRY